MAEQDSTSRDAGSNYDDATQLSFSDARNGLKYLLLRLSQLGLTAAEQEQLRELGRLSFNDLDATHVADQIANTETASPLAIAIVNIVRRSGTNVTTRKMAMLGAVLGAYAAISANRTDSGTEVILAAVAGAVAVSTSEFLQNTQEKDSWMNFVQRD